MIQRVTFHVNNDWPALVRFAFFGSNKKFKLKEWEMIFLDVVVLKHICKFFDTISGKKWSLIPLALIITGWS